MKSSFKKVLIMSLIAFSCFFLSSPSVEAAWGKTTGSSLRLRKEPSASSQELTVIRKVGTRLSISEEVLGATSGCTIGWGKTTYNGSTGYICLAHFAYEETGGGDTGDDANNGTGEIGKINVSNGPIRYGPSTSYNASYTLHTHDNDPAFYINKYVDDEKMDGSCPSNKWAYITYIRVNGQYVFGYMCTSHYKLTSENPRNTNTYQKPTANTMSNYTDAEFETYLTNQGFPEAYKVKLRQVHKQHPTWIFTAYKTPYSFSYSVDQEDNPQSSRSLIYNNGSNDGYLSTHEISYNWYTNLFSQRDGGGFYNANSQTIAYYMNPLNWLDSQYIFYFETIAYNSSVHTLEAVQTVLDGTNLKQYASYFIDAAKETGVSPVYLASLSRQEVGAGNGPAVNGNAVAPTTCSEAHIAGINFSGYYNFYNIQATSSTCAVYLGLNFAKDNKWTSPKLAIIEGAKWIKGQGYADKTLYQQKWDLSGFWKQYMTNVAAQIPTSRRGFQSSVITGKIEEAKEFLIPVFSDLTTTSTLPNAGNPNNYLNKLTVNGISVSGFDGAKTAYTVTIPSSATSISIGASAVASTSAVSGTGTITINTNTTSVAVKVTAKNGSVKTYTINLNKEGTTPVDPDPTPVDPDPIPVEPDPTPVEPEKPTIGAAETVTKAGYKLSDNYVYGIALGSSANTIKQKLQAQNTGATITVNGNGSGSTIKIVSGKVTTSYTIVIYGDVNGDGNINTLDIVSIQRHILKDSILKGTYFKATDSNRDGSINTLDIVMLQRHILNTSKIPQN